MRVTTDNDSFSVNHVEPTSLFNLVVIPLRDPLFIIYFLHTIVIAMRTTVASLHLRNRVRVLAPSRAALLL